MHRPIFRLALLSVALAATTAQAQSDRANANAFKNRADDFVRQFPGMSMHGNDHSYTLHLWRPTFRTIPLPPVIMV